jgi:hypothetical protein
VGFWNSVNWDWETGVCTKHKLPQVPCPACLSEIATDPDAFYVVSEMEAEAAAMTPRDRGVTVPKEYNPDTHGPVRIGRRIMEHTHLV